MDVPVVCKAGRLRRDEGVIKEACSQGGVRGAMKCCGHEMCRSSPADGMIDSWVGICVREQVRGIVTGTIEGKAGVDGMYTIEIWITY